MIEAGWNGGRPTSNAVQLGDVAQVISESGAGARKGVNKHAQLGAWCQDVANTKKQEIPHKFGEALGKPRYALVHCSLPRLQKTSARLKVPKMNELGGHC